MSIVYEQSIKKRKKIQNPQGDKLVTVAIVCSSNHKYQLQPGKSLLIERFSIVSTNLIIYFQYIHTNH